MSDPLLRFEDGKIVIGGVDLFATSASLSVAPNLEVERVYGDFDPALLGAKTEFVKFAPTQGLRGQLEVAFLISAEQFIEQRNINTISQLFDIAAGMKEDSINDNIVGRYKFDNMYLKSFGFDVSPFQVIRANATYDIYGSIERTIDHRFQKSDANFAHGLKSFGQLVAGNSYEYDFQAYIENQFALNNFYEDQKNTWDYNQDGISEPVQTQTKEKFGESYWTLVGRNQGGEAPPRIASASQFEIANLKYNILVNRKIVHHIRGNENTGVNTRASGAVPVRVSVESIEKEATIESNEIIEKLNAYGDPQNLSTPFGIDDSRIEAYLLSMQGEKIASFSVAGKIQTQSMNISEGQYAKGSITIKEIVK